MVIVKKNILFDFDGTLADTSEGIIKSMHYAFDKLGCPRIPDDRIRRMIGPPLEEMFEHLLDTSDHSVIQTAVTAFRERYAVQGIKEFCLYDGVKDVFDALVDSGKRLYIVTSKPEPFVKEICQVEEILDYFSGITGALLKGIAKSKAERMRDLMAQGDMNPYETVMVGDRAEDVIASKVNNIDCIGVLYGFGNESDLRAAGCTGIAESVVDIVHEINHFSSNLNGGNI